MIIKFNLLPHEKKVAASKKAISISFANFYIIVLIILLTFIIGVVINFELNLKKLKKEKKEKEELLNKYKNIALKVKKLEEEKEEIKKRISAIIELKKDQGQRLRVIYYTLSEVKENKVLINSLKAEPGKGHIKGYAFSFEDVANYLKNLEANKQVFKNVELKSAVSKQLAGYSLVEFESEVQF
jgi:Tfp pilus assembly protein PilN